MRTAGEATPLETQPPRKVAHQATAIVEQLRVEMPRSQYTVTTRVHKVVRSGSDGGTRGVGGGASSDFEAAVEIELSVLAPRNREVILRLHASAPPTATAGHAKPATAFYTHDGLAWRKRGAPPGESGPPSPAAAFFPTAVGAALDFAAAGASAPPSNSSHADGGTGGGEGGAEPQRLTVLFDRSVGVARLSRSASGGDAGGSGGGGLEVLIHRSLAQDDGRGLFGPAFDDRSLRCPC